MRHTVVVIIDTLRIVSNKNIAVPTPLFAVSTMSLLEFQHRLVPIEALFGQFIP